MSNPINAISLGLGLMFGTAGLPHILMRFFTVTDAKEARKSLLYASGFVAYFLSLIHISRAMAESRELLFRQVPRYSSRLYGCFPEASSCCSWPN